MKSLFETILKSTNSGKQSYIQQKTKEVVDKVLTSTGDMVMFQFLEKNKLWLDRETCKRIATKLKKVIPHDAVVGAYGSSSFERQAKNGFDDYGTLNGHGYYDILLDYGRKMSSTRGSISTEMERIIALLPDRILVDAIPETKDIIDVLNQHFEKYTEKVEIRYSNHSFFASRFGAKYLEYKFEDLKKEFVL